MSQSQQAQMLQVPGNSFTQGLRPVPPPPPDYANRIDIERAEHDATLRFYRDGKDTGKLVKEITVPLSVLDALSARPEE